jgi:D-proline reductase (dithiol) PrdB
MTDPAEQESFEEFKNSFSYGSRSDLNFKFLKSLSPDRAADFFQELLHNLGDSVDDGQIDRLIEVFYQYQCKAYAGPTQWTYEDGPFTKLDRPVAESRVALLTSSGHFVAGHDPQPFGVANMTQAEAAALINDFLKEEPALSTIPIHTPLDLLRVRHGGYDIRSAQADPNVALPITRLQEAAEEARIGSLAPAAYSFVGACAQTLLSRHVAPGWAAALHAEQVDAVVMVPV